MFPPPLSLSLSIYIHMHPFCYNSPSTKMWSCGFATQTKSRCSTSDFWLQAWFLICTHRDLQYNFCLVLTVLAQMVFDFNIFFVIVLFYRAAEVPIYPVQMQYLFSQFWFNI